MILETVYLRFYRAFNYDYTKPEPPSDEVNPWDIMEDGEFHPYVKMDLDRELTTVVGANESGKSQLLDAIECGLGAKTPGPADFCRYSTYFTVTEDMKKPHVGLRFGSLTPSESDAIQQLIGNEGASPIESFRVFRTQPDKAEIYVGPDRSKHEIDGDRIAQLNKALPRVFRIRPELALPNSVPIQYLAKKGSDSGAKRRLTRNDRFKLVDQIMDLVESGEPTTADIEKVLKGFNAARTSNGSKEAELNLAFDLLATISKIDPDAFDQLKKALREDDQGMAIGIVEKMNRGIEEGLNLAACWSQDPRFRLEITVGDLDVIFTIRDRTDSAYSFAERSHGLKFFLSYLVQFLTHLENRAGADILLMDEPDTFLSNQGQQDLLRLLQTFPSPTDETPGQVVYVTHSPFLIDRNRPDRIRVLDKGSQDEGTRVVPNASHNHYEPIRTALGGLFGESVFLGNCNLILEGTTDQIYLARMSTILQREGNDSTEYLDLNRITLVSSEGAPEVPHRTYLATGRATNKPAVIVLLDGDQEGDLAARQLQSFGRGKQKLIRPEYVVQLKPEDIPGLSSDRSGGHWEIEDLIPVEIGLDATKQYLKEMGKEASVRFPTPEEIRGSMSQDIGVFKAIQDQIGDKMGIELAKYTFARHVIASCEANKEQPGKEMRRRYKALFSRLTEKQHRAEQERDSETIKERLGREITRFCRRHQRKTPTKGEVAFWLSETIRPIVEQVEQPDQQEGFLEEIRKIREDFGLDDHRSEPVGDWDNLCEHLKEFKFAGIRASRAETQTASREEDRENPPTNHQPARHPVNSEEPPNI